MDRFRTGAACAALILPLAACGGGSGGTDTPPVTLKGVSYERFVTLPTLNQTEGSDGGDFQNVIFVDEGFAEFLGTRAGTAGSTTEFRATDGSVALVTALPGFESTRLIRIIYQQNGVTTAVTEGVIGRFTNEALMATARGSATYRGGAGTAEVRVERSGGGQSFDLTGGSTIVAVDFGTRRVDATLDFRGTASGSLPTAVVDLIEIDGMTVIGNRFSGGALSSSKGTNPPDPAFSVTSSALQSSGIFAGWNDTTGAVAGGNRPAEVAGAFVANAGVNVLTGRYLAD
jgi:hypothetical protein